MRFEVQILHLIQRMSKVQILHHKDEREKNWEGDVGYVRRKLYLCGVKEKQHGTR